VAGIGRNWQELAGIGRNWQELAGIGRNWQELAGIIICLYCMKRPRTKRHVKRRSKTKRAGSTKPKKSLKELLEEKKLLKAQPPTQPPIQTVPNYKSSLTTYMTSRHPEEYTIASPVPKVALLFIIIDDLPLEHIWHDWLANSGQQNGRNVEVFFHAKFPERVRSKWVQDRLIRSNLRPSWGSIELSKAMYYLLEDALHLQSFTADYFIFLSESCIPIYSIDDFFRRLQGQTKSWIDYTNTATNGYAYSNQFAPLKEVVPETCVYKSDQWVMLNRQNAMQLMDFEKQTKVSIWNLMANVVKASDEMWIPTILCMMNNGLEHVVEKRKVTYVDWGQEMRSPITFEEITPALIQEAREKGCLFMRKFKARNPMWLLDDWRKTV